jgi:hypothetical protein
MTAWIPMKTNQELRDEDDPRTPEEKREDGIWMRGFGSGILFSAVIAVVIWLFVRLIAQT